MSPIEPVVQGRKNKGLRLVRMAHIDKRQRVLGVDDSPMIIWPLHLKTTPDHISSDADSKGQWVVAHVFMPVCLVVPEHRDSVVAELIVRPLLGNLVQDLHDLLKLCVLC